MKAERVGPADEYGEDAWLYSDGSIRRSNGTLVKRHPNAAGLFQPGEHARSMAKLAHETTKEKVRERLLKRALEEGLDATCPADAYAAGIEHMWARTLEVDEPLHGVVQAQKLIGKAGDFLADTNVHVTDRRQVTINVTADVADRWAQLTDAVDAEFADVDDDTQAA